MKNLYFLKNIKSENAFRSDFTWPILNSTIPRQEFMFTNPSDILNLDWLYHMKHIDVPITSVILFHKQPFANHNRAHIDTNAKRYITTCAINWVYCNGVSSMSWYNSPPQQYISNDINIAPGNTHSFIFDINDLELIDTQEIKTVPALVRTNIPHSIYVGDCERWSVSVRFGGKFQTWESAIAFFKSIGEIDE